MYAREHMCTSACSMHVSVCSCTLCVYVFAVHVHTVAGPQRRQLGDVLNPRCQAGAGVSPGFHLRAGGWVAGWRDRAWSWSRKELMINWPRRPGAASATAGRSAGRKWGRKQGEGVAWSSQPGCGRPPPALAS